MSNLIFQTPARFKDLESPDVKLWIATVRLFTDNVSFIDRSGVIVAPIKTSTHEINKIPMLDPSFNMSFEECVIDRVKEIYQQHLDFQIPIRIYWSGGIDSTTALLGFIDYLGISRAKEVIEIIMNHTTIMENPLVWEKCIRGQGFKIINASHFNETWDKKSLMVNGECGDQVQGSDLLKWLYIRYGADGFNRPWREDEIFNFVKDRSSSPVLLPSGIDDVTAKKITDILVNQINHAPMEFESMARVLAWINFSCKWCSTFYRIVTRSNFPVDEYTIKNYYFPFYASVNFQQWAMKDNGEKHKGSWVTYKWAAKDYICKILGDQGFQLKHRYASLIHILSHTPRCEAIDDQFNFYDKIVPEDWYNPNNSFK
jgi:hypothetical protein